MEDFNNLKDAWKNMANLEAAKDYSVDELRKIVRKKSNSELAKMRRKILVEWSVAIFLSVVLVVLIHFVNPVDTKWALLFIGLLLGLSFIPYLKVIRLKFSNHSDLKSYLRAFIIQFEKLISQYVRMATFLIPLAGLGGFLLGFHGAASSEEWQELFTFTNLLFMLVFVLVISLGGFWLQKRYFKWIYGKNMQRLKGCLSDLEDAEMAEPSNDV